MLLFSLSEMLLTVLTVCSSNSRMFFAVTLQLITLLRISYVRVICLAVVHTLPRKPLCNSNPVYHQSSIIITFDEIVTMLEPI